MSDCLCDIDCPACGISCWVNNGDISDLTVPDVEAIRCWNCHHEFLVDEDDDEDLDCKIIVDSYQSASQAAGN